jgi:Flp pilus assembly secretin CpaC
MKSRFQFRIATLLWLMVCVASFFAGRHWDEVAKAVRPRAVVTFNTDLHILNGTNALFDAHMPVTRIRIADPAIATITPETQNTFTVTARRKGTTTIRLWSESANQTATCDVTVK